MTSQAHFLFVQALARDLQSGEIKLPSVPAVVLKIRKLLEEDNCSFEIVGKVVSSDTALVSKLFLFANSVYHNRSGKTIVNLEAAIANLGLDLVKSTAVALALKQLAEAKGQSRIVKAVQKIWARSMRLSSMSHSLAEQHDHLNDETAFMCGLFHDAGKLYVLSKAKDVPDLASDPESFGNVLNDWSPQIGRSIVEAWGFPEDVAESLQPVEFLDDFVHRAPKMVDVVYVARLLIDKGNEGLQDILDSPSSQKLGLNEETVTDVLAAYRDKLVTVQQSLA